MESSDNLALFGAARRDGKASIAVCDRIGPRIVLFDYP
jgi:hypothetical protein